MDENIEWLYCDKIVYIVVAKLWLVSSSNFHLTLTYLIFETISPPSPSLTTTTTLYLLFTRLSIRLSSIDNALAKLIIKIKKNSSTYIQIRRKEFLSGNRQLSCSFKELTTLYLALDG